MRSDWANPEQMEHILAAMMPDNRLVMRVCMATALRVSDALNLRTDKLRQRMTVRELKTGKNRRIYLPIELYHALVANAGKIWVFESRTDATKHRTRQAVYKDVKRAAAVFQRTGALNRKQNVTTHTGRKVAAVDEYHRTGSMTAAAKLLNHSSEAVTALYALADALTDKKIGGGKRGKKCR